MTRHFRLLSFWLLLFAGLAATPAHAQVPKVGDFYEDAVDIGFKVPERKYTAWPTAIREAFAAARAVRAAKPTFRLTIKSEDAR